MAPAAAASRDKKKKKAFQRSPSMMGAAQTEKALVRKIKTRKFETGCASKKSMPCKHPTVQTAGSSTRPPFSARKLSSPTQAGGVEHSRSKKPRTAASRHRLATNTSCAQHQQTRKQASATIRTSFIYFSPFRVLHPSALRFFLLLVQS